jgi:DNA mismatch endonuclease, patch repair protein
MDTLAPHERSERMSLIRGKNSKAELTVRSLLHRQGFRFRLHQKNLAGCPDIVFSKKRKAIFVHGCFWHRHLDSGCPLARLPKSRLEFWLPKLEGNRRRDLLKQQQLLQARWKFLIVWECELRHMEQVKNKLLGFLESDDETEGC